MKPKPILAICGVRFSPNLGDGVISDCVAWLARTNLQNSEVVFLDLAGRASFGAVTVANRRLVISLLNRLPKSLQSLVLCTFLGREVNRKLRPAWRSLLAGVDFAVIGGGQLLSDANLNFPLKLRGLIEEIRERDIPTGIYACGASISGKGLGCRLLREVLVAPQVKHVSVRDPESVRGIELLTNGYRHPGLAVDPAVHVADAYSQVLSATKGRRFDVGVGLSHPENMKHASGRLQVPPEVIGDSIAQLCRHLTAIGKRVALFTNGAEEDECFLTHVAGTHGLLDLDSIVRMPRPSEPAELVSNIAEMTTLVSHRLHASIIAFGLSRASVGLDWDNKVSEFYTIANMQNYMIHNDHFCAGTLIEVVEKALNNPPNGSRLAELRKASCQSFSDLLASIGAAGSAPS